MPCYSIITRTKMTDAERLEKAMRAVGFETTRTDLEVAGAGLRFTRYGADQAFVTTSTATARIAEVGRKYAELTVRDFAARRGYAVTSFADGKITLQNRRG